MNKRVKRVNSQEWRGRRLDHFKKTTRFAAAAKAYRTAQGVTQAQVAERFDVEPSTVSTWESGKYTWQGELDELHQYFRVIDRIAKTEAPVKGAYTKLGR